MAEHVVENHHVSAQCDTLNEALSWVVQQVDARGFDCPRIEITPVFMCSLGEMAEDSGRWVFEVSVGAEVSRG